MSTKLAGISQEPDNSTPAANLEGARGCETHSAARAKAASVGRKSTSKLYKRLLFYKGVV